MSTRYIRAPGQSHVVVVPEDTARDFCMSFRAVGVLTRLLSNADGFPCTAAMLAGEGPGREGRDAVRTALRELETRRYIVRHARRVAGKFAGQEALVYSAPQLPHGEPENPFAGKPLAEMPVCKSSNSIKKVKAAAGGAPARAAAAPYGAAKTRSSGRRFELRPSGIECWWPDDQVSASAIEAEYSPSEITAAVDAVHKRSKSPAPGVVVEEIRAQRRACAASAARAAVPTATYDPVAAFRGELEAISSKTEVDTP